MLDTFLAPQTLAVIVTSQAFFPLWQTLLDHLIRGGFRGEILPVSPQAGHLEDRICYASIQESGKTLDLAIILAPPLEAIAAVRDALKAKAKGIILLPGGFKEASSTGADVQQKIVTLCHGRGARLLGPNGLGVINQTHHLNASLIKTLPKAGGISIVSQSGALSATLLDWMVARRLGLAKMISLGNKADINETDCLRYLAKDPETRVIVCYLENILDGDDFLRVVEETSFHKPVIIQKNGNSITGTKGVYLHTGQLSGRTIAYGAAFKRSGVIHAKTYDALLDYTNGFSQQPLPQGNRVAIVTNSYGPGVIALDAVHAHQLQVARLSDHSYQTLTSLLSDELRIDLMVKLPKMATIDHFVQAVEVVLNDPESDAILVILTPLATIDPAETIQRLSDIDNRNKPILSVFFGRSGQHGTDTSPNRCRVPNHPSPERAVTTLAAMRNYQQWLSRPPRIVTHFPVNQRRVERIISRYLRTRRYHISGLRAKEILAAYGFTLPEGTLTTSREEAMDQAQRLGFPLTMHLSSPNIAISTTSDWVRTPILSVEGVQDAYDLMMFRFEKAFGQGGWDGIHLEKKILSKQEMIIGMNRDRHFGPILMVGLGGSSLEVMPDISFHLAPITADEALQMLKSTRLFSQLSSHGRQEEVDIYAIVESLQRISQLSAEFPQISEIVINPLAIGSSGTAPIAVEAHLSLTNLKETPP